jgi:alpha-2-macroglobulin
LIAKRGADGSSDFYVTDIKTTQPVSGTTIEVYDFQKQLMATIKTDSEGKASAMLPKKPFLMVAKNGQQRGYLKLDEGNSLPVSMFEVKGDVVQKGIKGFIYGERGVWRPGDTLFLSFIMESPQNLPQNHPVSFELFDPQGKSVRKMVKTSGVNGMYNFTLTTSLDAPTGNYLAKVKVGGASFSKTLKIETVMPNRLKINLNFPEEKITATKGISAELETKWLHGATARNLKAKVELSLQPVKTTFPKHEGFAFDDPTKEFASEPQVIFDSRVNEFGRAKISHSLSKNINAPGKLKAEFFTRIFEEGGNASIDKLTVPCSPYTHYVGVKAPEGERFSGKLNTDTSHTIQIATLDEDGKPVSRKRLQVQVYKVHWRWWWESNYGELHYLNNTYYKPIQTQEVSSVNGKGTFKLRINSPEWGRYLVHVTDLESGHSAGQTVYIDWPYGTGSSPKGSETAALLSFTADKEKYKVGEKVKLLIPSSAGGRALVSIESGSRIIQSFWVNTAQDKTEAEFTVTSQMSPNVYINVSLIQPHAQSVNDLPIRLYGIIPVQVEDPQTNLKPVIKTADSWRPEEKTTISVSEENGKEMTYTLAVVDDGLLDLTRFKTPDPWKHFYAKEALGVKTWDLFDMVIGAHGGKLNRLLALGGDGDAIDKGGKKAQRFKPMVRYLGPFHLKAGKTETHEIMIPQYIGSVRVMVVAAQNKAYGASEKTVAVKRPLMVLGTLPRVIGPGETFDLPVTVFAMEKNISNVKVEIAANDFFTVEEWNSKTMNFSEPGDDIVTFKLKTKNTLGVGKIKVVATSGNEKAVYETEIDVRNPNSRVVQVIETVIEAGQSWNSDYEPFGTAGTNKAVLEFSSIPPVNLGERLKYLIAYPHGCVEQTTSAAFPQLYLADIMEMNSDYKTSMDGNIKFAIQKLRGHQNASGGFSYWQGHNSADDWSTSYAGHFLLEAEAKGYSMPHGVIDSWKRYQRLAAQNWSRGSNSYHMSDFIQAYRLYTLALAKSPEMGAMNRLKESPALSNQAKWRLAAAYALAGQPETAKKLISDASAKVTPYREMDYTYGSGERDEAMILEAYLLLGEKAKAATLAKSVSKSLNSNDWMSTQATSWCLLAVSKFAALSVESKSMAVTYAINGGNKTELNTKLPVRQVDLPLKKQNKVELQNRGTGPLFARIILEGVPLTGDQTSADNNLGMTVSYTTINGNPVNIERLEQGTDFIAEITIRNPSVKTTYRQMALSQVFPSGWEIKNMRITDSEDVQKSDSYTHQDIRDDRVYTYFDVAPGKTVTYRVVLNATYTGRFYLPSVYCEAMYDNTINSKRPGQWVEVVKSAGN